MTNLWQQALVNHSIGGGKSKGFEMPGGRENERNGDQDPDSFPPSSQLQVFGIRGCRAVQIDVNRVEQTSLGSPPFDDVKGLDNESSDQGSEHATGPMLHYSNGNQVVGSEVASSNVIHVHTKCIEWLFEH